LQAQHDASIGLIPQPVHTTVLEGSVRWSDYSEVFCARSDWTIAADRLRSLFEGGADEQSTGKVIWCAFDPTLDQQGSYRLHLASDSICLSAGAIQGLFNGISSLRQLMALYPEKAPALVVWDHPRFVHRGMLLDCCRHFFSVDVVKKYIDLLSLFKMNVLHWHLTEDQGWRIEIEGSPRLNEHGAYRTETDGSVYGGYYSKEEIRELVRYAAERGVEIIPEIELPGHAQAAISAYPELSCRGAPVDVANDWGVFKEIYCAGNDSVFFFLENVLLEVMELFPSTFIHIGGDEAPKTRWEACAKCQKRIESEGLADEHELQSYFIRRIELFLREHGRQLIGWDEILEGGLAEGAIVQSWRGVDGGIEAVRSGHRAIMSPTSHAYFDYDLRSINLEKVYSFEPVPEGLSQEERQLIIGGECNMWTEHVLDEEALDAKVFPRLLAMSERLWSPEDRREWTEFKSRVQRMYPVLEEHQVGFGAESVPMSYQVHLSLQESRIALDAYDEKTQLLWHFKKRTDPELISTVAEPFRPYSEPIAVEDGTLSVQATREGRDFGPVQHIETRSHLAVGAEVSYSKPFSSWYTAGGPDGLVNSVLGSTDFRDGCWQGFWGIDPEIVLDLRRPVRLSSVELPFYQYTNSWIFIPPRVKVAYSADGQNWEHMGEAKDVTDPMKRGKFIRTLKVAKELEDVRYLRIEVENLGKVPDAHEAAGSDAWVFLSEIIVL
jgi:hexosaminidase